MKPARTASRRAPGRGTRPPPAPGTRRHGPRAWPKPTLMTDSLVRKDGAGQRIGTGWALDVHGPTGAPKESFVKISKAEDGGIGGGGPPAAPGTGVRPP